MKVKNTVSQIIQIFTFEFQLNDRPYGINSGYLLFFETTIMGRTADMAMVQKTIIDTLHKEGPQTLHRPSTEGHYWKGWLFTECCIKAY